MVRRAWNEHRCKYCRILGICTVGMSYSCCCCCCCIECMQWPAQDFIIKMLNNFQFFGLISSKFCPFLFITNFVIIFFENRSKAKEIPVKKCYLHLHLQYVRVYNFHKYRHSKTEKVKRNTSAMPCIKMHTICKCARIILIPLG